MDGLAVEDKRLNFQIKSWPKPSSQSWSLLDITVLAARPQAAHTKVRALILALRSLCSASLHSHSKLEWAVLPLITELKN